METPSEFVIVRGVVPPAKWGVALTTDGGRWFTFFQFTIAEMCGDPESISRYKDIYIRWPECRGSRHPSADRKCGDDWGQDEAGPQDHDKGNHKLQNTNSTTCKCILEMLGRVEVTAINMTLSLPKYLRGINKRPGVSGCVHPHQWESCSKYTHKESLSYRDELFPPPSLKLSAIRVAC